MAKTLQSLAQASLNRNSLLAASLATALLFFAPARTWAEEKPVPFHGQESAIFVDGDPLQVAVGDPATDGELILVFTNAAAANTLRSTLPLSMRVLIVGGGGAGGYGTTSSDGPGGGGGGGGEVIELENKGYQPGTYQMIIGAGGRQTTAAGNGENGHPSSFTADGTTHTALGGGGGGSNAAGNSGTDIATGGGG